MKSTEWTNTQTLLSVVNPFRLVAFDFYRSESLFKRHVPFLTFFCSFTVSVEAFFISLLAFLYSEIKKKNNKIMSSF